MVRIDVDLIPPQPKNIQPELLQHPNIPRWLAGVNPRNILGKEWWDWHRKEVYKSNNNCCLGCGVHVSKARYRRWLEAHELYEYHWEERILKYIRTVPLCFCCHQFIHCGRLYNTMLDNHISRIEVEGILLHGFKVLYMAKLEPNQKAVYTARLLKGKVWKFVRKYNIVASTKSVLYVSALLEPEWRMEFQGKFYNSLGKVIGDAE